VCPSKEVLHGRRVFDDLRQFIEGAKKITEWREIKGASWDLEISTLIEATAELIH
jgi:hypothetical protein